MRNPEQTIGNMIDKQSTVYISSVDENGYPCTRAMLGVRERDGIKVIYFSTNTSSNKVEQYKNNPKASIYLCDKRFFRGCLLKGKVEVLTDEESKKRLWREGDTTYYSGGITDPDYCVLKFTIKGGRYYSNFKSEDFEI